jgi:NO-binding membrane sensor protein with MHYT domain
MHYVGMLALRLPVAVRYDTVLVAASLLAAILASAIALLVVTGESFGVIQILTGSLIMGSGIGAMHYTGMAAMNMPAECHYRTGIVILSIAIAIAVSAVALAITFWFRREGERSFGLKLVAAVIMGTGICAMHYTGMMAVTYTAAIPAPDSLAFNVSALGAASLSTVALMILTIAILASLGDRRFSAQAWNWRSRRHCCIWRTTRLSSAI